jgi:hypothetical protein
MPQFADYNTFLFDTRGSGVGTAVAYRYDASIFAADSFGDISMGEMVAWDATNKRVLRFNRTLANGKFIGIARDSARGMAKLGNQPGLALRELSVYTTGVHGLVGTVGDTYVHGDAVYMAGSDTTKVTKTAGGGTQIGIVWNTQNQSFVGAVRVPVLIDSSDVTQV